MLIGKTYTTRSDLFLNDDKEYEVTIELGSATSTYDKEGEILLTSQHIPSSDEVQMALDAFQGECHQTPPMFSAKKTAGQKTL